MPTQRTQRGKFISNHIFICIYFKKCVVFFVIVGGVPELHPSASHEVTRPSPPLWHSRLQAHVPRIRLQGWFLKTFSNEYPYSKITYWACAKTCNGRFNIDVSFLFLKNFYCYVCDEDACRNIYPLWNFEGRIRRGEIFHFILINIRLRRKRLKLETQINNASLSFYCRSFQPELAA